MIGLDPTEQNWESGIDLTVLRSTFFRNFVSDCLQTSFLARLVPHTDGTVLQGGNYAGGLEVHSPLPFVGVVEDTDFIHNDATLFPQDLYFSLPPVRNCTPRSTMHAIVCPC